MLKITVEGEEIPLPSIDLEAYSEVLLRAAQHEEDYGNLVNDGLDAYANLANAREHLTGFKQAPIPLATRGLINVIMESTRLQLDGEPGTFRGISLESDEDVLPQVAIEAFTDTIKKIIERLIKLIKKIYQSYERIHHALGREYAHNQDKVRDLQHYLETADVLERPESGTVEAVAVKSYFGSTDKVNAQHVLKVLRTSQTLVTNLSIGSDAFSGIIDSMKTGKGEDFSGIRTNLEKTMSVMLKGLPKYSEDGYGPFVSCRELKVIEKNIPPMGRIETLEFVPILVKDRTTVASMSRAEVYTFLSSLSSAMTDAEKYSLEMGKARSQLKTIEAFLTETNRTLHRNQDDTKADYLKACAEITRLLVRVMDRSMNDLPVTLERGYKTAIAYAVVCVKELKKK